MNCLIDEPTNVRCTECRVVVELRDTRVLAGEPVCAACYRREKSTRDGERVE